LLSKKAEVSRYLRTRESKSMQIGGKRTTTLCNRKANSTVTTEGISL